MHFIEGGKFNYIGELSEAKSFNRVSNKLINFTFYRCVQCIPVPMPFLFDFLLLLPYANNVHTVPVCNAQCYRKLLKCGKIVNKHFFFSGVADPVTFGSELFCQIWIRTTVLRRIRIRINTGNWEADLDPTLGFCRQFSSES